MKTDLIEIFQTLRAHMQPYAVAGFKNKIDTETAYHLCVEPKLSLVEQNQNEIYFFGVEVKQDYVGLYCKNVYTDEEKNFIFSPNLIKILKDNECFHITALDDLLLQQISDALKLGFKFYKKKGWV